MKTWQYPSTFPTWSKLEKSIIQQLSKRYQTIGVCSSQYHQLNRVQRHWINANPSVLVGDKYSYPVFLLDNIHQDLFGATMQNLFAGSLLLCFFDELAEGGFTPDLMNGLEVYQWFARWGNLVCVMEKCYDNQQHYVQYYCQDGVVMGDFAKKS